MAANTAVEEDKTYDTPDEDEQNEEGAVAESGQHRRKSKRSSKFRKVCAKDFLLEHQEEEKYKEIHALQRHYYDNAVHTTKYTVLSFLPKNLFEQFHRFANVYFVAIVLLNFVPQISAIQPVLSMLPVIGILLVQAIKDIFEDYGRYKSDKEVNYSKSNIYKRFLYFDD